MSSSSEDLLPLINRVQNLASSQPTTLASDDDDVPLWLRNYTSPKPQQPKKLKKTAALLSDSDDEPPPPSTKTANHAAATTTTAATTTGLQPPAAATPTAPLRGTSATAALLGSTAKGNQVATWAVVLPYKAAQTPQPQIPCTHMCTGIQRARGAPSRQASTHQAACGAGARRPWGDRPSWRRWGGGAPAGDWAAWAGRHPPRPQRYEDSRRMMGTD